MKNVIRIFLLSLVMMSPVHAGPFSDALARCVVEKTENDEKILFIKWMYAGMSKHPQLAGLSTISDRQSKQLSQVTADMVVSLMVDRCTIETQQAIDYEGEQAFVSAFEILGTSSMMELMRNQRVNEYLSNLDQYIDEDEFSFIE